MNRYLSICLTVVCMAVMGCEDTGVRAQAPGTDKPIASKADAEGQYGLYHATTFDMWGVPQDAKLISSYHLEKGDPIGFQWVIDKSDVNRPNSHLGLEAYAGDHHQSLGGIRGMTEKYYWADTSRWSHHWTVQPVTDVEHLVTLR